MMTNANSGIRVPIVFASALSKTPSAYDEFDRSSTTGRYASDLALLQVRLALSELQQLPENWDGYGSARPDHNAISQAHAALPDFYEMAVRRGDTWAEPHVSANEGGEILFEWWTDDRKLSIYFSDTASRFIRVWGVNPETEMADGEIVGAEFADLYQWLHA